MSYRPLVVAAAVTALSATHIANAAAQSVYVAPGGVYIGAGAGPVYVTPAAPTNGAAAYVGPGYGYGYGAAAYVPGYDYGYGAASYAPGYDYGYGAAANIDRGCDCGYGTVAYEESGYGYYGYGAGTYVAPRYGYGYGSRPYVAPGYRYGYGSFVPTRRYYGGPRSAYAAALPPRPRMVVPYRTGRAIRR
jgi:hypothetical protein